jgi:hypothetical protein
MANGIFIEYQVSFQSMRSSQRLNLKLKQMKKGRSKTTKKGNKRSRQNCRLGIDQLLLLVLPLCTIDELNDGQKIMLHKK